jgi:hypothetical protein
MISESRLCPYSFASWFLELIWISYSLSKWRLLCSLSGHTSPSNYHSWAYSQITIVEHVVQFYLNTLMLVLWSTSNHISLKHKSPDYCYVVFRHVYRSVGFKFSLDFWAYLHTLPQRLYDMQAPVTTKNFVLIPTIQMRVSSWKST